MERVETKHSALMIYYVRIQKDQGEKIIQFTGDFAGDCSVRVLDNTLNQLIPPVLLYNYTLDRYISRYNYT